MDLFKSGSFTCIDVWIHFLPFANRLPYVLFNFSFILFHRMTLPAAAKRVNARRPYDLLQPES